MHRLRMALQKVVLTLAALAAQQALSNVAFGSSPMPWFYAVLVVPVIQTILLCLVWFDVFPRAQTYMAAVVQVCGGVCAGIAYWIYTSSDDFGMRGFPSTYVLYVTALVTGFPAYVLEPVVTAMNGVPRSSAGIALGTAACLVHYSMGILSYTDLNEAANNVGDINLYVRIAHWSGIVLAALSSVATLVIALVREPLAYAAFVGLYRCAVVAHLFIVGYSVLAEGLADPPQVAVVPLIPASVAALYIPMLAEFPSIGRDSDSSKLA